MKGLYIEKLKRNNAELWRINNILAVLGYSLPELLAEQKKKKK